MIKFGDIGYFVLLDLEQKLKRIDYDRLDLTTLDKLRNEVYIKIQQINLQEDQRRQSKKEQS